LILKEISQTTFSPIHSIYFNLFESILAKCLFYFENLTLTSKSEESPILEGEDLGLKACMFYFSVLPS
jgi:hypothetical protein